MNHFIVSARKYRPDNFSSVVGQDSITTTLKNTIKTKQLGHAYLFCGPRGVGKTTCARIFAKTINCSNLTSDYEPCNQCESCVSFNEMRAFNIHELDAASNNSVEDIRNLTDQVRIPPQVGKYSIYIIDEVHMLSAQAFNAFLKTLEEPPSYAVFILATTEKQKIIPTVLSRCQIFDFNRIRVHDIVKYLEEIARKEGVEYEPDAFNIIALKADGAMRDALSIFDQMISYSGKKITYKDVIENLNVLDYDYYFRITDAFLAGNIQDSLLIFNEIINEGFDGHNFIIGLGGHFRDLLVCRDPETLILLETGATISKRYKEQSERCDPDFLFKSLDICGVTDIYYKSSRNQKLHVELALIKLCQITNVTDNKSQVISPAKKESANKQNDKHAEKQNQGENESGDEKSSLQVGQEQKVQGLKGSKADDEKQFDETIDKQASKTEKPGSEGLKTEKPEPEELETKESGTEDLEDKESEPEKLETEKPEPEELETKESGTEDMENKEPETEELETEEPEPEELGTKESGTEDLEDKESEPEKLETEKPEPEDLGTKESGTEDMENKEPETEELETEESKSGEKNGGKRGNIISKGKVYSSGYSIKDVLNGSNRQKDDPEGITEPAESEKNINTEPFSSKKLNQAWNAFAEKIKAARPRMYNTLKGHLPEIGKGNDIELVLDNTVQQDEFQKDIKQDMLMFIREVLKNDLIVINTSVKTEERNQTKLYTSEEKYKHMLKKNPDLDQLKQEFNLDFE